MTNALADERVVVAVQDAAASGTALEKGARALVRGQQRQHFALHIGPHGRLPVDERATLGLRQLERLVKEIVDLRPDG
jgi:hypothetical protein